jgi:hypothetical protein
MIFGLRHARLLVGALLLGGGSVLAQEPPLDSLQLLSYARAHLAIAAARDQVQAELAEPRHKKTEAQLELREKLRLRIEAILKEQQLTPAEYDRITHRISRDGVQRKAFDATLATLTARKPAAPG